MSDVSQMSVEITADTKGAISGIDGVDKKMADFSKSAEKVGKSMTTFVTLPILAGFGAMIKGASDFNETVNKVAVAFGEEVSPEVIKWGDTTLKQFGIAKGTALDMIALYGDMGTSMGIPQDKMATMGQSLVGLAGDLSSFKNISLEASQNALKGIFTGETESLKGLGIIMNETTLNAYALDKGLITMSVDQNKVKKAQNDAKKAQTDYNNAVKKYGKASTQAIDASVKLSDANDKVAKAQKGVANTMTQAELVQLRYNFVMDATKNSQGDFSNTSDGTANSMRSLSETLKEASASFGTILLPIITPVIQAITNLLGWISGLDENTKAMVLTFLAIVASVGPILLIVAKAVTVFEQLQKITILQTAAQWLMNTSWLGFPVVWIVAGIVALVAIIWVLYKNWDTVIKWLSDLWTNMKIMFTNVLNAIVATIYGWVNNVKSFFVGLFDSIITTISGWANNMKKFFTGAFDGLIYVIVHFNPLALIDTYILKPFKNIDLFSIGKNVIQGFLDGAGSLFRNIGKFFIDLLPGWIVGPFKWALGIKSPSKVFAGFGDNIGQGLINGMTDTLGMVKSASMDMADMTTVGMPVNSGSDNYITMPSATPQQPINAQFQIVIGGTVYQAIIDGINDTQRLAGKTLIEV